MQNSKDTFTLKLTQEELLLILLRYRLPLLVGLSKRLVELPHEQMELLLEAAERSLIAREFQKSGPDGKAQLEPLLFTLVASCAQPEKTLVMSRSAPGEPTETMTINLARKMTVIHIPTGRGIHHFTALPDPNRAIDLFISFLDIENKARSGTPAGEVAEAKLVEARELAGQGQVEQAAAVLEDALGKAEARELVQALGHPALETAFMLVPAAENEPPESVRKSFHVLESEQSAWLLTPHAVGDGRQFAVTGATVERLREALQSLFP